METYCDVATELVTFQSPYLWSTLSKGILCTASIPIILYLFWTKVLNLYSEVHYANTFSLTSTMFCLVLDAGIAILRPSFYRVSQQMLTKMMLSIVIFSFIFVAFYFFFVDVGHDAVLIHCVEDDDQTRVSALVMSILTIILDLFTLCGVFSLWLFCRRKLRAPTMDVNERFQLRLSFTVLTTFGPVVAVHTFFLVEYNLLYGALRMASISLMTSKIWQGILTLTPLYTVTCPLLVRYFINRSKEQRNVEINRKIRPTGKDSTASVHLHFEELKKSWEFPIETPKVKVTFYGRNHRVIGKS
ncbi:unnamed protein product, partial [Mesorhabditis belari]|uniref:Uncharacterized protein n=1 Tax=Mesorhabditis belari TaxID=2138241 RepID=A0AAF3FHH8_9BILA